LNQDSNLCYGEGGAGTWSDGKLSTGIGKNSVDVRSILQILVDHGASPRILVDGKPHVGTDKLVRILQSLRRYLTERGCVFRFGCTVSDFITDASSDGTQRVKGVILSSGEQIIGEKVILGVGHSARTLYRRLLEMGVKVEAKPFAVGFRVEHSQDLINKIQYGDYGIYCQRGEGVVPVADYKLTTHVQVADGTTRSCYSFCMCPGGQIGKSHAFKILFLYPYFN